MHACSAGCKRAALLRNTYGVNKRQLTGAIFLQALLEAERKGMVPLLEAPKHFHDKDGTIKVPPKWENILKQSEVYKEISSNGPPRTPPRSPLQSNPPKT